MRSCAIFPSKDVFGDPLQDLSVELSSEVNGIVHEGAQAIPVEAASPSAEADPKELARCS